MAHIFIAYSRKDQNVAAKIVQALTEKGLDTWIDWSDIPPSADWEQEIFRGIEQADTFLFLISPDSVVSQICIRETEIAVRNNKRIIPILIRNTESSGVPVEISKRNWIPCRVGQDSFDHAIEQIQYTIHTDYDWIKFHTELQIQALDWERRKDNSFLLRGARLREAIEKLAAYRSDPLPTDLQRLYVLTSQKEADRLRTRVTFIPIIFVFLIAFMGGYIIYLYRQLALIQAGQLTPISPASQVSPTFTRLPPTATKTNTPTPTKQPTATDTQPPVVATTALPQVTATSQPNKLLDTINEKLVLGILTAIGAVAGVYLLSILAIALSRSRSGSSFFSRTWLTGLITRTSKVAPGATRKMLLSGYTKRLLSYPELSQTTSDYFGVPALDPENNIIVPDEHGDRLNEAIADALDVQKPVLITGNAGAGKSTLLARWTRLGLTNKLPNSLNGYIPILVDPAYYDGNLVEAITATLSGRDDLPVNEEIVQTLLETGKYLILFDGVSEIGGDQQKGLNEILRTAKHANYKNNRFLITSRPSFTFPSDVQVFQLQPLSFDVIQQILSRDPLKRKRENQFSIQLKAFGMDTIEPLLFSMMITQGEISYTRSQLYELFFCRKLKLTINDSSWDGWRVVLEELAKLFMLDSGRRGIGIPHEKLINIMAGDGDANLVKRLGIYGVFVKDELGLLEKLRAAGLLSGKRRWRFAQDSYEEYFAASYVISQLIIHERFPHFPSWADVEDQQRSFLGTIQFIREMAQELSEKKQEHTATSILRETNLPTIWKETLFSSPTQSNE